MHAHQDVPDGGRWVTTFATDARQGDKIRKAGIELYVLDRDYPPAAQPTFRLNGKPTAKLEHILIWDPGDGSVANRVVSLSAATLGGNSGSGGASGTDSIPPDYRPGDGDSRVAAWDSARAEPKNP